MKNLWVMVATILFFSAVFYSACQKLKETQLPATGPEAQATPGNCEAPQRYRDMIFASNQITIVRNEIFRYPSDYAPLDDKRDTLYYDFYSPNDTDTTIRRPLIILIHGGGFTGGERISMDNAATRFARYGYCVASIDYRLDSMLLDTTNYFTANSNVLRKELYRAIQDTRFAVRFAKEESASSRIDTNYIFTGGISAGAITSLHVAYLDQNEVPIGSVPLDSLGSLDYEGYPGSGNVTGAFAYAGGLIDLSWIQTGNVPSLNIFSKRDTYFPYECGLDYTYKRQYVCGGKAVYDRLQNLSIPSSLILYEDLNIYIPQPVSYDSLSHGSVFTGIASQNREVDSTCSFLYRKFHPDPCP